MTNIIKQQNETIERMTRINATFAQDPIERRRQLDEAIKEIENTINNIMCQKETPRYDMNYTLN